MGMDKEATDIWVFGRKRPDISIDETIEAYKLAHTNGQTEPADPVAFEAHREERFARLMERAPEFVALAKAKAAARGDAVG